MIVIQNIDIDAKKKDYEHLEDYEMLISSDFFTIQGEGPFAGRRSYFIRTAGCNFGSKSVACSWCDTSFQLSRGKVQTFAVLMDQANRYLGDDEQKLVVITGGEPLLQPNTMAFCEELVRAGFTVQIETNGAYLDKASKLALWHPGLHIVCSPKQVGRRYAGRPKFDYTNSINPVSFKFVVSADPNESHHELPSWAYSLRANTIVYVSPMTVYKKPYEGEVSSVWDAELIDQEATAANYKYAAKLVMENPDMRLSCQVHTFLGVA